MIVKGPTYNAAFTPQTEAVMAILTIHRGLNQEHIKTELWEPWGIPKSEAEHIKQEHKDQLQYRMSQTENQQREEPAYIPHETALKE
jgi:hypothetical protein